MKYIKSYNEELSPSLYRKAANDLRDLHGHRNRASQLDNWATELEERKFRKQLEENRKDMSSDIFGGKLKHEEYDYRTTDNHVVYIDGNFHAKIYFDAYRMDKSIETSWDGEVFNYSVPLTFHLSIISADDETQSQIRENFFDHTWPIFTNIIEIGFITRVDGVNVFKPNNALRFYSDDYDTFYFSNRNNALKFKRMFIRELTTNTGSELQADILEFLSQLESENIPIGPDDYDKIVDSIKSISLNHLYRE